MKKIFVIIPKEYVDSVSASLLKLGVLDFVELHNIAGIKKNKKAITGESSFIDLRKRIEYLFARSEHDYLSGLELDIEKIDTIDTEKESLYLDELMIRFQTIKDRQRIKQEMILRDEELERLLLRYYGTGEAPYISLNRGLMPSANIKHMEKSLSHISSVIYVTPDNNDSQNLILATLKRDENKVDEILTKEGWNESDNSLDPDKEGENLLIELRKRLNGLRKEQEKALADIEQLIFSESEKLQSLWINARLNELDSSMRKSYGSTTSTMIFSGWVPIRAVEKTEKSVRQICGESCYIEWSSAEKDNSGNDSKAPVELKNPKILKPFESLVKNYDLPEYGTVDPTPFVAIAYLMMFGLMFGDFGHGLVVFLTGLIGLFTVGKKNPGRVNLLKLFMWCGISAMIFGILFGSYFGYLWFKPLWFDYHGVVTGHTAKGSYVSSIMDILGITIRFGIGVIAVGIILNFINCASKKDWLGLIFGKQGILGAIVYASGLYSAFYFVGNDFKALPSVNLLLIILILPAFLVGLAPLAEHLHHRKLHGKASSNKFIGAELLMNGIVEILEVFMSYLSNTLSFMRVAGLGIAHVCLMVAFFQIAGMFSHPVISVSILVLGNLLVIVLEGLSAGIQSLRLNYYEFFSKYFRGAGRAYIPIRLTFPDKKEVS